MHTFRLTAVIGLAGCFCAVARPEERNFWPFLVEQTVAGPDGAVRVESWQAVGPLLFHKALPDGGQAHGFRPFYLLQQEAGGQAVERYVLYPIFIRREDALGLRWTFFHLVNYDGPQSADPGSGRRLDVWPFYFSRETSRPHASYHAVFPLRGSVLDRFGHDRISWTLFPLYGRFEKRGVVTTTAPWPFIKVISGEETRGFELWPLFGRREKSGDYREQFYLWPFFYKNEARLSEAQPDVKLGALPFYALERSADAVSESYFWPFFGHTHRTAPRRYDETRWFWPLLVQGRGDDRLVNRWAPFYAHSINKGVDKHWVLWPFFRREKLTDEGLVQTKTQFLYFLYWSLRQQSAGNPDLAPAQKSHLWPLYSYWDNGAGRRQLQLLSPIEVLLQHNDMVRLTYFPLFALYRYEQHAPGDVRHSFLWDAITWRRQPERKEFHLGPLIGVVSDSRRQRIAIGGGLFGLTRRRDGGSWRFFVFDFASKTGNKTPAAASP